MTKLFAFQRLAKRYVDGSPSSACDYVFALDGKEMPVEVHAMIFRDWRADSSEKLSQSDVEAACIDLIESGGRLVLNEETVRPIAKKLGWKPK